MVDEVECDALQYKLHSGNIGLILAELLNKYFVLDFKLI
jgi:hypothetical protein